jgi:chaperonin cofactor prefoldin
MQLVIELTASTMDSINNDSYITKSKKSYYVERNYAPNTIPSNLGVSSTTKLFNRRQQQRNAAYQRSQLDFDKLRTEANLKMAEQAVSRNTPHKNTLFYMARLATRENKYRLYTPVPCNISPWFNLLVHGNMHYDSRLAMYNKRHKCPHGHAYTSYSISSSIKIDGSKHPVYMTPHCHCSRQHITQNTDKHYCGNCTNSTLNEVHDQYFKGFIHYCKFCKNYWHRPLDNHQWTRVRPSASETVHTPAKLPSTTAGWASVPTSSALPVIAEVPEFPSISQEPAPAKPFVHTPYKRIPRRNKAPTVALEAGDEPSVLAKFIAAAYASVSSIKTWIMRRVAKSIARKATELAWDGITTFLKTLVQFIMDKPATVTYLVSRLFTTESGYERLHCFLALLEHAELSAAWSKITGIFGDSLSDIFTEKYNAKLQNITQTTKYRQELRDIVHAGNVNDTLREYQKFQDAQHHGTFVHPTDQRPPLVKNESAASILGTLFGFILPKTPTALDILKHFNTIFTGWKNIQELMTNFLEYLPTWLQKLFTISDPRKRFGHDLQTPGNPVYDMHQAYVAFIQQHDSLELYREFLTAWRASEHYINIEYIPNEMVYRLHKHVLTNADSIHRPHTQGSKPIPFVVTLYGMPGTGKSSTWPLLLAGIVPGQFEDIRRLAHCRNPGLEFFDGYDPTKHPIFVYDDFGSNSEDNSAVELMAIVSTADFLPAFADLPSKGQSFDSPIVVLNSNFKHFNQYKMICSGAALNRRLGIIIDFDAQWKEGLTYQVSRANREGGTDPINRPGETSAYYSLPEIQQLLAAEYTLHFSKQSEVITTMNMHLPKVRLPDFMTHYEKARMATAPPPSPKPEITVTPKSATYTVPTVKLQSGEVDPDFQEFTSVNNPFANLIGDSDPQTDDLDKITLAPEQQFPQTTRTPIQHSRNFGYYAIINVIKDLGRSTSTFMRRIIMAVSALSAAASLAFLAWKIFGDHKPKVESESGQGNVPKAARAPVFGRPAVVKYEAGDAQDEAVLNRVTRNQIILVNDKCKFVNGIMIRGRILLTVKHFLADTEELIIHSGRSVQPEVYRFPLSDCRVVPFDDVDLALIELPNNVSPYTDLFSTLAPLPHTKESTGYTSRRTIGGTIMMYETTITGGRELVRRLDNGKYVTMTCDFRYKFTHANGDCGNVILAQQGGSPKIIGMHQCGVVGSNTESYAIMLNQIEIAKYLKQFGPLAQIHRESEFPHETVVLEEGIAGINKTEYIGTCSKHIHTSGETELRPSTIFDKVQIHTTKPALLRRKGNLDPFFIALGKLGVSTKQFPRDAVKHAVQSLTEELMSHKLPSDLDRLLTIDECLNGIPGLIESIDTSKSSGYPFSLSPHLRGAKSKVLDGEPGSLTLSSIAQTDYDRWTALYNAGIIPSDPYIATLKDEKRPIEKVDAGKTRTFCAGSMSSMLHDKRLFAGFATFFKRIRSVTFSTLGLNRASQEWHQMIQRFMEVGENGLDGDQKEWDGRFKASIAFELLAVFAAYYKSPIGSLDYQHRYVSFCHMIFTHLRLTWLDTENGMTSIIILVPGNIPSGCWLTFKLNCLVNATLMRTAWILLVSVPYNDLSYFRTYTREKYAGDDNFVSVADSFLDEFNNITISILFAKYDQLYTPASKSGELVPYQPIVECQFLKTVTGYRFDRWVPLFNMSANLDTLNWIRKCDDPARATEDNCNDVLRNLFFYGEIVFNEYRSKILQFAPKFNLVSFFPLHSAYLEYGSIPDPFGSFGYTKNAVRDPAALYRSVQKSLSEFNALSAQREVQLESGDLTMNTTCKQCKSNIPTLKCLNNEINQLQHNINRSTDRMRAYQEKLSQLMTCNHTEKCPRQCYSCETFLDENEDSCSECQEWFMCRTPPKQCTCKYPTGRSRESISEMQARHPNNKLHRHEGRHPLSDVIPILTPPRDHLCTGGDKCDWCSHQHDFTLQYTDPIDGILNADQHLALLKQVKLEVGDSVSQPVAASAATPGGTIGAPSNIDDSTPKVSSAEGVHLAEQQDTVVLKPVDGNSVSNMSFAQAHLNEKDWDLSAMLHRYNLVGAFAWNLTDAVGTEISINAATIAGSADVPKDLLQNDIVSAPFTRFQWWRCDKVKVRFQLVASRFHQGRLLVYYVPTMLSKIDLTTSNNYGPTRATQIQHCFLDPSNGTVVDFEIPFRFNKGFIDLVFGDCLGQLHVQVLNQLQAATGASPSVEVKAFVSFENSHFRVPRQGGVAFTSMLRASAERLGFTMVKKDKKKNPTLPLVALESGIFKNIGSSVGGELDTLVNSIIPADITGAIAGILMDKPAITEIPPPLVHKDAQYMSNSRGVENLERMALEPSAQYITTTQFGDNIDECDMKYLLSKPIYLTTFNWPATATVGTVLYSTIVSPGHLLNPDSLTSAFDPTIIGALANLFTYWRGGLTFKLQVVGTAFHEGRFDLTNNPGEITPPSDYPSIVSQYVNSQTVRNTNNMIEVRIPFLSDTPWKRVWNGEVLTDVSSDISVRGMDYAIGTFSVIVSVPLKSPNNVANNVDVNVFVSASDDFEFHTLSLWGGNYSIAATFFAEKAKKAREAKKAIRVAKKELEIVALESGDLNTDPHNDTGVISLATGPAYTHDGKVPHFGENYHNLREMCKRYRPIITQTPTMATADNYGSFQFSGPELPGLPGLLFNSFRLFRGPMNFKLDMRAVQQSSANYYDANLVGFITTNPQPAIFSSGALLGLNKVIGYPSNALASAPNPLQVPLIRFSNRQVGEFQVPFQSIFHSLMNFQLTDDVPLYFTNMFTQFDLPYDIQNYFAGTSTPIATFKTALTLSMSFADETRLGVFLGFPQLVRNPTRLYPNPSS